MIGAASLGALLFGTVAIAQFRAFQLTVPSKATKSAVDEARAAVAAGESTDNPNKIPRQSEKDFREEIAEKCKFLPSAGDLKAALVNVVASNKISRLAQNGPSTTAGGLDLDMWGVMVNRQGEVCAVVYTGLPPAAGDVPDQQWLGSRVIAAQKANAANSFSLTGLALSTANLFYPTQNGQSLYGLQHSNPVDTSVAYSGSAADYGTDDDGMLGKKIGGINVFGGGVALYSPTGVLVGGLGVSGDTSCADHIIAWKTRYNLNFDNVPGGVGAFSGARRTDNIIHDLTVSTTTIGGFASASGFGHPTCSTQSTTAANNLVTGFPTSPNP
jgi:uncharacterized protein GlcG (DUF336 family)